MTVYINKFLTSTSWPLRIAINLTSSIRCLLCFISTDLEETVFPPVVAPRVHHQIVVFASINIRPTIANNDNSMVGLLGHRVGTVASWFHDDTTSVVMETFMVDVDSNRDRVFEHHFFHPPSCHKVFFFPSPVVELSIV